MWSVISPAAIRVVRTAVGEAAEIRELPGAAIRIRITTILMSWEAPARPVLMKRM
jgi:hypothetical protein